MFICGGALAVFLLALKYVARARSGRTQWLRNLLVALLLSGVYLTSALWYLRQHWHDLVLRYWEYVLGYVAVSGILGVVAVQMQRNDAKDRHRLAVIVKWIIRAVGVTLLYNSTASPFGSLTLVGLTVLLYLTYALYKPHSVVPIGMHDTDGAAASKKEQ